MSRKDNELFISISEINLIYKVIIEFFNWTDFLKMEKSDINMPFINYWSKFRQAFLNPRNFVYTEKILAKLGPSGEPFATPSYCL